MHLGAVAIVVVVLMIAGCAGTTGTPVQAPAVEAKSDAVASQTRSAPAAPATSSAPKAMTSTPQRAVESVAPIAPAAPTAYAKNRTASAIVVAVGGGLSNGAVGPYMESYKQDLHKTLQEEIRSGAARVDQLPHHVVRIQVPVRTAFDADSSSIKPDFCATMDKLADAVIRYGKTTLTVVGYPDGKISAKRNQKLSQQRALSVARYLESKAVDPVRLATFGKSGPDSTAGTDSGHRLNRALEIIVEPVLAKRASS